MNNERPRPQFGELAPEGWSWTPPGDADTASSGDATSDNRAGATTATNATSAPETAAAGTSVSNPPITQHDASASGGSAKPDAQPAFGPDGEPVKKRMPNDLFTSIALMVIGLFFTITGTPDLVRLRLTMNQVYDIQGLGPYPADAGAIVDQVGIIAAIVQSVILLVVIGLTTWLIGKRRRSFYVPLAGGVLAILCNVVAVSIALMADPNILDTLSSR